MERLTDYSQRLDGVLMTLEFCKEFFRIAPKNGMRINAKNVDKALSDFIALRCEMADGLQPTELYLKFKDNTFIGVVKR